MLNAEVRDFAETLPKVATALGVPEAPSVANDVMRRHNLAHKLVAETTKKIREASGACATLYLASERLLEIVKATAPVELSDPEGQGTDLLETAESFLNDVLGELNVARDRLRKAGIRDQFADDLFREFDRLCDLNAKLIASMQDIRWAVLIADGLKEPVGDRVFQSGKEWLAAALED